MLPERGKKEDTSKFLKSVSAFANAEGGDLIYGLKENGAGAIEEIVGLNDVNKDEEELRLRNLILNGLDPRIDGIRMCWIEGLENGSACLVVRVPRSPDSPHMVSMDGNTRFYKRTGNEVAQLNAHQIRNAFVESTAYVNEFKKFRNGRLDAIDTNETPVPLSSDRSRLVIHVAPVSLQTIPLLHELGYELRDKGVQLPPPRSSSWNTRYNFDGYVAYDANGESGADSYVQLFSQGQIEAVLASIAREHKGRFGLPGKVLDTWIIALIEKYLKFLEEMRVMGPYLVAISLLDVRGAIMFWDDYGLGEDRAPIDRRDLRMPEILVRERQKVALSTTLRPALDSIWRATGWAGSPNFDDAGKFVPRS